MLKFCGKGVYGTAAVGKAWILKKRAESVPRRDVGDVGAELDRLRGAIKAAVRELSEIRRRALGEAGEEEAQIFEIHAMMLEDGDYVSSICDIIVTQGVNAEYAVSVTADKFADMLEKTDDPYMQARSADVRDVSSRLLAKLSGDASGVAAFPDAPVIVCASELTPAETVMLDRNKILAFVTAHGSSNSHTAILARSMRIPAVVGVGGEFLEKISDGTELAVDGHTGEVYVSPDEKTLSLLAERQKREADREEHLKALKGMSNETLDGRRINIFANIGGLGDIGSAIENDAGGIGLFRSEFLYLEGSSLPTEEEQLEAYREILSRMEGRTVIIRTLDVGADKKIGYLGLEHEENPALGLRAIRFCLAHPDIFKTQLRALLRASAFGELGIMFPMITGKWELDEALRLLNEAKAELDGEGTAYGNVKIGIMIETPAAALISDKLAPSVDFFSVGTNDLTQYTLACDRQNPRLEKFCDPHHEAIIRLIETAAKNAHAHGKWIGICGELAADTSLTETFLRIGIDELSVSPPYILPLRDTVRNIRIK